MRRPVFHDKSFADKDELLLHIANLETYVDWLLEGISRANGVIRELAAKAEAKVEPAKTTDPFAAFGDWSSIFGGKK